MLVAIWRENGNSDEPCSPPRDRVGPENADLVAARTECSQVIDGGLQGAARVRGRHGSATRVNLELTVRRGRSSCLASHASTSPFEERPGAPHRRVARVGLPSLGPVREYPSTSIPQPHPGPAHPASPDQAGRCRAEPGPFPPSPHHHGRPRKVTPSRGRITRSRDLASASCGAFANVDVTSRSSRRPAMRGETN